MTHLKYEPHLPDFWDEVDRRQVARREQELMSDHDHYELEDLRRQYPPIPLCDTLINISDDLPLS